VAPALVPTTQVITPRAPTFPRLLRWIVAFWSKGCIVTLPVSLIPMSCVLDIGKTLSGRRCALQCTPV
jgi:hypothetical protein